jgi:PIN domain nuclease of toxin-antitoxin system
MRRLLLDTHTVIWFFDGNNLISKIAKKEILDTQNEKFISIASVWEVAIKISLGKFSFDGGINEFVRLIKRNGFCILPVEVSHIYELETLPFHHRDPFDRIIIAAAIAEKLEILSADRNFGLYGVRLIW